MENTKLYEELYALANQHLASGMDFELIKDKLIERCTDEEIVATVLGTVKRNYYARRTNEGTNILCIGLVLILIGFVITCFNFHSNQSVTLAMYGLTSLGILIVFFGLYKIMG